MPELPEVETICSSIQAMVNQKIQQVAVRQHQLRFPIPKKLPQYLKGAKIQTISRRAKYLLLDTDKGTLLIHLGMSGRLRLYQNLPDVKKHDHVDIVAEKLSLRFTDPRRFGAVMWTTADPLTHTRLVSLGVEPLSDAFNTAYLFQKTRNRQILIKQLIMDSKIVVGVGNIYAAESLFKAGIHPQTTAHQLTRQHCQKLVSAIRKVLKTAIACGGTTLNDFCDSHGDPGYFKQELYVYGRQQEACRVCKTPLEKIIISQRSTVFCPQCQGICTQ